jgi:hypothetical protein
MKILDPSNATFEQLRPTAKVVLFNVPVDQGTTALYDLDRDAIAPGSEVLFVHTETGINEITVEESMHVSRLLNAELIRFTQLDAADITDPYNPAIFKTYMVDDEQDFAYGRTLYAWAGDTGAYSNDAVSAYMEILRKEAPRWRVLAYIGDEVRRALMIYCDSIRIGTQLVMRDAMNDSLIAWAREVAIARGEDSQ